MPVLPAVTLIAPAGTRTTRGRVRLSGVTISAPNWAAEIEAWCEVVGLDPPVDTDAGGLGRLRGLTRRRGMAVHLVDDAGQPALSFLATTDDLEQAVLRASSRGAPVLAGPTLDATGNRVAVLQGPLGLPVRVIELTPKARMAALTDRAPRRAEAYLRQSAVANGIVSIALAGFLAHLAVANAPNEQVSFGFLIGACTLFAAITAFASYPNGVLGGESDHAQGAVRTLRGEVAGTPEEDPATNSRLWAGAARAALTGAAVTAFILGLASFALLGRPIGFWVMWAWAASLSGSSMVVAGAVARRRGVLFAGRRAHGLPVEMVESQPFLRRAWRSEAIPLALISAAVNAGAAWAAYRYGVTAKTLSSDLVGSVIFTAVPNYLIARGWGRADFLAGRVTVPAAMRLPARVRLGAQGLVFGIVAELILLYFAGHAFSDPSLGVAVGIRVVAAVIAGGFGFGLGAVAGTLNTAADQVEGPL